MHTYTHNSGGEKFGDTEKRFSEKANLNELFRATAGTLSNRCHNCVLNFSVSVCECMCRFRLFIFRVINFGCLKQFKTCESCIRRTAEEQKTPRELWKFEWSFKAPLSIIQSVLYIYRVIIHSRSFAITINIRCTGGWHGQEERQETSVDSRGTRMITRVMRREKRVSFRLNAILFSLSVERAFQKREKKVSWALIYCRCCLPLASEPLKPSVHSHSQHGAL